jgi:Zn finger protein HypA/HybF involved in hydrogenase expression
VDADTGEDIARPAGECPGCWASGSAVLLGVLGTLAHFRCRYCGAQFSEKAADVTVPCGHCGGEHLADRSCDCFDNGCQ